MRLLKRILPKLDPQAAPIIWRLAKPDRSGRVRKPLTLAILLAAATGALGIAYVASLPEVLRTARFMGGSYQFHWNVFDALAGASLALLLISPPVIAAITAILVSRDSHSEAWVLIRVTNLTRRPVFQGYAMAALYRLRLLLVISFGLLPLIAFSLEGYVIRRDAAALQSTTFGMEWANIIWFGLLVLMLWGCNLLALSMGVDLGFHILYPASAGAMAIAIAVGVNMGMLLMAVVLPELIAEVVSNYLSSSGLSERLPALLILLCVGLIPYAAFLHSLKIDGVFPDRRLT